MNQFQNEEGYMGERHIQNSEASDERIRKYLVAHLAHALRYPALADVMFEVKNGSVTLSGTVPHRVMKHSIEETAASCPGVTHIENKLNVALTAPWPDLSSGPAPHRQG
jgi:osmotically-inducible protein OsmY